MSASHKRSGVSQPDIHKALDALATSVTQPKGVTIFQQGDQPRGVFLVRKGTVRLTIRSGRSEFLMRVAHEGTVLGLPAVMSDHTYSLTAKTAQNCELGFVERKAVIQLVKEKPALGMEILQMLSDEVRNARIAAASSRKVSAAHA